MFAPTGNLIGALPHNGPGLLDLVVETILLAIAHISLALRLWSRRLQGAEWQLNDWLIIVAAVNPFDLFLPWVLAWLL